MHNAIYTSASIATQSIAMNFLRYLFMYATIHGDIIAARPVAHEYLFVTYSFSFSFRVSSDPYFDSRELSSKGRGGGEKRWAISSRTTSLHFTCNAGNPIIRFSRVKVSFLSDAPSTFSWMTMDCERALPSATRLSQKYGRRRGLFTRALKRIYLDGAARMCHSNLSFPGTNFPENFSPSSPLPPSSFVFRRSGTIPLLCEYFIFTIPSDRRGLKRKKSLPISSSRLPSF